MAKKRRSTTKKAWSEKHSTNYRIRKITERINKIEPRISQLEDEKRLSEKVVIQLTDYW
ncbi:hypothetical protein [Xenorhabdus bovienii]|uniref:hypothetical protein n=1 Tax=Xenorhabdus bovienii TaxID=40576 RepID=UPI0023B215FB|nr:hypothetical protein [Xenorhabdus bovienii]MDE9454470.1 hypothetical protein [Xenorhabdus bovienii]MDE9459070.1 hypothetical protein [Xenorhabdus bovienii]MDE9487696.1 hypothetical protein [Xenorhabdus bovienii]MDE9515267.1 hypothetical protein [Xenorhabdus bovienii]